MWPENLANCNKLLRNFNKCYGKSKNVLKKCHKLFRKLQNEDY